MAIEARAGTLAIEPRINVRALAWPATLAMLAALCLPLLFASPANLTSDESLYLAEAYSIAHGDGFAYPSGEPITHRAPLYPIVLAPAVKIGGPDAAYAVAKAIVLVNIALVALLALRMSGGIAAALAAFATAASAYVNGLGTTLYLDPLQCTFMLAALLALHEASRRPRMGAFAASGVALGLAFLVKESAVQWAPLAFVAWLALPSLRSKRGAAGALVFTVAFATTIAPWMAWVYVHTGQLYMLGEVASPAAAAAASVIAVAACMLALSTWPRLPSSARSAAPLVAMPLAAAFTLAWCALLLYALTAHSGWPYPNDYLQTVPAYLRDVAPNAQPFFLLAAAGAWIAARSLNRDDAPRLIVGAALLFVPFALFAANRNLQLRDALPLVYLAYVALGIAAADAIAELRRRINQPYAERVLACALALAAGLFALQQAQSFRDTNADAASEAVRADSWDSGFVREIAAWMESELPDGARILSSRLYFSSLYVHTEGRYDIRQMPTVRVDIDPSAPGGPLVPRSNLFRWGDGAVRNQRPGDDWLYIRQFPEKRYWVALSQQEMLEYIAAHEIDYVVLTGDDVAFSSMSYAAYFSGHPAFTLVEYRRHSGLDQLYAYQIDRARLAEKQHSTAISPASAAALAEATGMPLEALAWELGRPIRITDHEYGLSEREEASALAGIDLGWP